MPPTDDKHWTGIFIPYNTKYIIRSALRINKLIFNRLRFHLKVVKFDPNDNSVNCYCKVEDRLHLFCVVVIAFSIPNSRLLITETRLALKFYISQVKKYNNEDHVQTSGSSLASY